MSDEGYPTALRRMSQQQAVALGPAASADLAWLAQNGAPPEVTAFYTHSGPLGELESEGVFLLPLERVRDTASNVAPGAYASRYGYLVIAKTVSGDAYALAPGGAAGVVMLNHERIHPESSAADMAANSRPAAPSFGVFLEAFVAGRLPYDFESGW